MTKIFWNEPLPQVELFPTPPKHHTAPLGPESGPTEGAEDGPAPMRPEGPEAQLRAAQEGRSAQLEHSADYCLSVLARDESIWDMRNWHKYKDIEEIRAWLLQENPDSKNSGHAGYCIGIARLHNVPLETMIEALMSNPNVSYKNRLVACMVDEMCPSIDPEKPNYCEAPCWKCNGLSKDPQHVERYICPTCQSMKVTWGDGHTYWEHPAPPKKSPQKGSKTINKENRDDRSSYPGNTENGESGSAREPVVQPAGRTEVSEPGGSGEERPGSGDEHPGDPGQSSEVISL